MSLVSRLKGTPLRDWFVGSLYYSGLSRPERTHRHGMCAVSLHRVLPAELLRDYPIPEIAATPEELGWFLDYFSRHFMLTTLRDGHERLRGGERPEKPFLAVTFDDGQRDNFVHAKPILDARGVKATFCVPTDGVEHDATLWHDRLGFAALRLLRRQDSRVPAWVERLGLEGTRAERASEWVQATKDLSVEDRAALVADVERDAGGAARPEWDGFMSWEQLVRLEREGHEVASHSVSHDLLPACSDERLRTEVVESKRLLESKLDLEVSSFCYPNGSTDDRVAQAVDDAGYRRAATTEWGAIHRGSDPFGLPRIDMEPAYSRDFRGRLSAPQVAYRMSRFHPRFVSHK